MAKSAAQIRPYPLGAHLEGKKIRFSFASQKKNCGILLYDRQSGDLVKKIPFTEKERIGNIYCKYVNVPNIGEVSYQFYKEDIVCPDRRARAFEGKTLFGEARKESEMRAVLAGDGVGGVYFPWEGDCSPKLSYEDCVGYCLHVRGFTMHPSSKVEHRGTFSGLAAKIPYLKETGITTVELQPAYEFLELEEENARLNYWGYKEGFYYTPKASYAAGEDVVSEFKSLVKEFHKNGMELVMQFYFPAGFPEEEIREILRFWVLEYHVDGFHLIGENITADALSRDPMLADTKLWYRGFGERGFGNLAEYNDDYLYIMRRFLKGDEDMLESSLYHHRRLPDNMGRIHYLSNYNTMTLMDMVSYDYKHNEANGEENRDGNVYNFSWNCGEEGCSLKKNVLELRDRQLRNAMCLLMLSQSTPLLFMGDEFGNSQQGNNNPYCQDNEIAWLDWNDLEKHCDLYEFWRTLVALRKEHPILRPAKAFRLMDHMACGYPDMSYHGTEAWRPKLQPWYRNVGIMLCGKYVKKDKAEDNFFYLAINMHWEPHEMALPRLPEGYVWEPCLASCPDEELSAALQPRSIVLYTSVPKTLQGE